MLHCWGQNVHSLFRRGGGGNEETKQNIVIRFIMINVYCFYQAESGKRLNNFQE